MILKKSNIDYRCVIIKSGDSFYFDTELLYLLVEVIRKKSNPTILSLRG